MAGPADDAFRTHTSDAGTLVVRAELDEAVRGLGFPRAEAVRRALAGAGSEGRQATAIVALPGREERVHLRPVRHGGLLASLWGERILGLGRPVDELHVTEALARRGAPVPRPALVAGWPARPLWSAVLGTVHIAGAVDGLAWLAGDPDAGSVLACMDAAGRAVRAFHEAGGRHADLHVKNLLVESTPVGDRVWVIDLDKGGAGDPPSPERRMLELMRLYRSLVKRGVTHQVGREARSAFFEAYTRGNAAFAQALLRHLPRERRRVSRHTWGYKTPRTARRTR
ncbi:MAG: lipopolysaccharide kinase InaA family protein [Myxococcota bacterium]